MPGATSGDVHTGLGHPGQGQTSTEQKHGGFHTNKREGAGTTGLAEGGMGLHGEQPSAHFQQLQQDDHPKGPISGHNVSRDGAEDKQPASSEEVAAEGDSVKKGTYDKSTGQTTGVSDRGAGNDHKQ